MCRGKLEIVWSLFIVHSVTYFLYEFTKLLVFRKIVVSFLNMRRKAELYMNVKHSIFWDMGIMKVTYFLDIDVKSISSVALG